MFGSSMNTLSHFPPYSGQTEFINSPTLPIMDIYGDVIGTDGHNLVMFDRNGKIVKPQINLGENLYPTYR